MDDWTTLLPITWPPAPDLLAWGAGGLVIAGLLGELVHRALRLPRLLGYGALGMLLTLSGHGLTLGSAGGIARLVVDLALSLLLFELGSRVNLRWLRANPALLLASLTESLGSGAAVFLVLDRMGLSPEAAAACACITMAASGAVVGRVASELRASGQVCERMLALTALNTVYAVLAFKLVTGWLHLDHGGGWLPAVVQPLYALAGSLGLAAVLARLVAAFARRADLHDENAALMLLGLLVLALCGVRMLGLSTLLVPLLAGVLLRNGTSRPWVWPRHFGTAGGVLVLLLFVITGSAWTVDALVAGAAVAAAMLAARLAARAAALLVWAPASGMSLRQALSLSIALSPLSGTSLVLFAELQASHPDLAAQVAPAVLAAIAIMELLGPAAVQAGLELAGEPHPRPRPTLATGRAS